MALILADGYHLDTIHIYTQLLIKTKTKTT